MRCSLLVSAARRGTLLFWILRVSQGSVYNTVRQGCLRLVIVPAMASPKRRIGKMEGSGTNWAANITLTVSKVPTCSMILSKLNALKPPSTRNTPLTWFGLGGTPGFSTILPGRTWRNLVRATIPVSTISTESASAKSHREAPNWRGSPPLFGKPTIKSKDDTCCPKMMLVVPGAAPSILTVSSTPVGPKDNAPNAAASVE